MSTNSMDRDKKVIDLLNSGATIPFIARYRKELTGGLNEVEIEEIDKRRKAILELEKRKSAVLDRLAELRIINPTLLARIEQCNSMSELEDLYLPYKQKRETKADKARKLGLEPLAKIIMSQSRNDIMNQAFRFTNHRLSVEDALEGAVDIMAEWVSESVGARNKVRMAYQRNAVLHSSLIEKKRSEAANYENYFDYSQPLRRIPSHRLLAILRAEKEGYLRVKLEVDKAPLIASLEKQFIRADGAAAPFIRKALKEAYRRLIVPAIETEVRKEAKERADDEAIRIFTNNLNQLLLAAPLGSKRVLAIDPGFRSGCKIVCLDEQGTLIEHSTIFPHPPQKQTSEAQEKLKKLLYKHKMEAIAIGNGTAGRETEQFVKETLSNSQVLPIYMVDEAGASIYSASEVGREEFPDLDLTVRGAISIGRRLMDPLAELVKIEPKNMGVGQYQHDVAQDKLRDSLNNTVVFAVNKVGVDVNTASRHLLQYVSGVGPKTAANIIQYRREKGRIEERSDLLSIKGFGPKAYEQAAGFLRIRNGRNPLDNTAVHPERYSLIQDIAFEEGRTVAELLNSREYCKQIDLNKYISEDVGLPTLQDIVQELTRPGLDPRGEAENLVFDERIRSIEDLQVRMILPGRVTNLTKFGAFVDIGIKQDGLVHISEITSRHIVDPSDVLALNQQVKVRVVDVDLARKRVALSMRLTD
ncbi:MAG: RNA-binding transcriptional accessory protein [Flavobacteriales bacterium]|nr:RNA-binding transcriptional accessory protein [Flavobacteriales bacterium]